MRTPIVVGRGRLGRSLAAGLGCALLPARSVEISLPPAWRDGVPACVLLAVPDAVVEPLAARIVSIGPGRGLAFAHLSGALGLDALRTLHAAGFEVGSFHPLQTFPQKRPPSSFVGARFAVDASSDSLLANLGWLARRLGGVPIRVRDADRPAYHAAATLLGHVVALADRSCAMLVGLGWSRQEALQALLPLLQGTLDNLAEAGLPEALSGPVRRGDVGTVQRHMAALHDAGDQRLASLYRILGLAALDLAREAGLNATSAAQLEAVLADDPAAAQNRKGS